MRPINKPALQLMQHSIGFSFDKAIQQPEASDRVMQVLIPYGVVDSQGDIIMPGAVKKDWLSNILTDKVYITAPAREWLNKCEKAFADIGTDRFTRVYVVGINGAYMLRTNDDGPMKPIYAFKIKYK